MTLSISLAHSKLQIARAQFSSSRTYITLSELYRLGPDFQSKHSFMLIVDSVSGIYQKELESLVNRFQNINSVQISNYPSLTNESLQILTTLPRLVCLDLGCIRTIQPVSVPSQITDFGLQYVAALKKLQTLDLSGLKITNLTLREVAKLPNLINLFLRSCHYITDEGLLYLAALSKLQSLDLMDCINTTSSGWRELLQVARFSLKYFNEFALRDTQ